MRVYIVAPVIVGSSPRGRGKLTFDAVCLARIRLIPARAGKTVW